MTASLKCVLDTNVAIKQFIDDPLTAKANQLFEHFSDPAAQFFVPDLFYIERANVFWTYVRAQLYTADQAILGLSILDQLPLKSISTKALMTQAIQISVEYNISAYDGCFVARSHQVSAPLLTLDKRLFNALKSSPFDVRLFTDFSIPSLPSRR